MQCVCVCMCVYAYHGILIIKKKEIMPFAATRMDLAIIILSEVTRRKTNVIYRLNVESKYIDTKELSSNRYRQTYDYQGGKLGI